MDIDPEEGVMLRLDYITYADTLDCLVYFLLIPFTVAHVRYDTILRLVSGVPCTIRSGGFDCATLYDINLRAMHTTIPSTRGVEIHISLVSSTTDSIQRCIVVFKPVRIPTSDPKSEFLCQLSYIALKL